MSFQTESPVHVLTDKNNLETGYFLQQDQTKNRNYDEYYLQRKYEQCQLLAILPERVATCFWEHIIFVINLSDFRKNPTEFSSPQFI